MVAELSFRVDADRCQFGTSRRNRKLTTLCLILALSVLPASAKTPTVQFGKNTVKVEVASTPDQIQRGLMYRTSMPEDQGMVFLFRPPHGVRFWMAHCFMSLDMVMIRNGKVVRIFENVPPCKSTNESECPTYPSVDEPEVEVDEVVEVNAGYTKRHGIKVGDPVTFKLGAAVPFQANSPAPPAKADGETKPAGTDSGSETKPAAVESKPEAGK